MNDDKLIQLAHDNCIGSNCSTGAKPGDFQWLLDLEGLRRIAASLPVKVPEGHSIISNDLRDFLNGSRDLEGVWFGERHPTKPGLFWWREYLPAAPKEGRE